MMTCEECGAEYDAEQLINELCAMNAVYYIADTLDEKVKLELFIEIVDKFTFTELQERLK